MQNRSNLLVMQYVDSWHRQFVHNFCMGNPFLTTVQKISTHSIVNAIVCILIVLVSLYISFLAIFKQDLIHPFTINISQPESFRDVLLTFVSLLSLLVVSSLAANALNILLELPVSFGATLAGVIISNAEVLSAVFKLDEDWDIMTHRLALVILIVRWGIGLQLDYIINNGKAIFWFGFCVPFVGAIMLAVACFFLLKSSWAISLLLGAILAASSTPLIMPVIVNLKKQGFGMDSGIPQFIPASVSINTFVCLFIFIITSTCAFSRETTTSTLLPFGIKVFACTALGITFGMILWYFPRSKQPFHQLLVLILSLSTAAITGMFALGCGFAGIVFVLILGSVCCLRRRKQEIETVLETERCLLNIFNMVSAPLLFVLVGMRMKLDQITLHAFSWITALIVLGFVIRVGIGLLVTSPTGYKVKSRLVILLSMVPKATLQGALAPSLIQIAAPFPEYEQGVSFVVNTAILVILLTGPVGKLLLVKSAPSLLEKKPTQTTLIHLPLDTRRKDEPAIKKLYLPNVILQRSRNPLSNGDKETRN